MTNWILPLVMVLIFAAFLLTKQMGRISAKDAQALLKNGATVIDVRTSGEFVFEHLPVAMNLPLSELEGEASRRIPQKDQVLLLHCHSGVRSRMALKMLKALGYSNVHDLGSYRRATSIVNGR